MVKNATRLAMGLSAKPFYNKGEKSCAEGQRQIEKLKGTGEAEHAKYARVFLGL